jgi:hypothetical protein
VSGLVPVNTALPTISGTATEGQTLSVEHGSWENSPTSFTYQWLRCESDGTACAAVSGAVGTMYFLGSEDVGHAIRAEVTAHNAGGTGTATSAATATVTPPAPLNTALPTIFGTPTEGQTLSATQGSWSHSPTSYSYQWLRCSSGGAGCAAIAGATLHTYTLTSADVGHALEVEVTAHNGGGTGTATSAPTSAVAAPQPSAPEATPNTPSAPAPPPTPAPAPAPGPAPGTAAAAAQAIVKHGTAAIELRCIGSGPCRGTLTLSAALGERTRGKHRKARALASRALTLGHARFSIAAGKSAEIRVHLSGSGAAMLRKAGSKGLKVSLGGTGVAARSVLLKEEKKKPRKKGRR